jgi:hypothetical protein
MSYFMSTIRSSIKPELMRFALFRGTLIATFGMGVILASGGLPVKFLTLWGIPLFFIGITCIGVGLLPYRHLAKLELKPHTLSYDGEDFLFQKLGKPLFKIPEISIEKMVYLEKGRIYGIGIWLKSPLEKKVKILVPQFNIARFMRSANRFEGCDLFLPFFSQKSFKSLLESDRAS